MLEADALAEREAALGAALGERIAAMQAQPTLARGWGDATPECRDAVPAAREHADSVARSASAQCDEASRGSSSVGGARAPLAAPVRHAELRAGRAEATRLRIAAAAANGQRIAMDSALQRARQQADSLLGGERQPS